MTASLEPGDLLGRWQVERVLGRGGMGTVYKIRDPRSKMPYAAKVLHPELVRERDFVRRFRREAKVARRLKHMNVVHVFALKRRRGTLFYVMEFVEGSALDEMHDSQGDLGLERTVRIIKEAAAGLKYIHSRRYVHRDVKPGNVLIRSDAHLKIADFGLAQKTGWVKRTRTGHVLGTAKYMAPELVEGGRVGPHTDVYALGCMAYELLAGKPPFEADNTNVLLDLHLYLRPRPLVEIKPGLDEKLDRFVRCMMAKRASRRVPSAQMVHGWFDYYLVNGRFADLPRALRRW